MHYCLQLNSITQRNDNRCLLNIFTYENFNSSLGDFRLDSECLEKRSLLRTKSCALSWHCYVNCSNSSGLCRCCNLYQSSYTVKMDDNSKCIHDTAGRLHQYSAPITFIYFHSDDDDINMLKKIIQVRSTLQHLCIIVITDSES